MTYTLELGPELASVLRAAIIASLTLFSLGIVLTLIVVAIQTEIWIKAWRRKDDES